MFYNNDCTVQKSNQNVEFLRIQYRSTINNKANWQTIVIKMSMNFKGKKIKEEKNVCTVLCTSGKSAEDSTS